MRFLILLAGIVVLILAFRSLLPRPRRRNRESAQTPEKMVACAQCRLYLPESEALPADGKFFCNHEHHRGWLDDQRGKKN